MEFIRKWRILTVVIHSIFLIHFTCAAPIGASEQAKTKLREVALFKNGLGFFVSEVALPQKEGSFVIVPLATPCHGTFWVSFLPGARLESLTAREIDSAEIVEAVTISELLRANVGRRVRLNFLEEEKAPIDGVIKYVTEGRKMAGPDFYAAMEGDHVPSRLIIVEMKETEAAIDLRNVESVEFLDGKAKRSFPSKSRSIQLVGRMSASMAAKKLIVSYLAKGISWAPSYVVDISEADKARISAKAVIINEICDLDEVAIQLVTGFPHLQFADIASPLSLKENLARFLRSLNGGRDEDEWDLGGYGGVYGGYGGGYGAMGSGFGETYEPEVAPTYSAAKAGQVVEDVFLYPVETVCLKKGEVGYYPLFTELVPYKHIYQWKIPDYVNEEDEYEIYLQGPNKETQQQREIVWHCLRLENTTRVPWTTAPAETIKDGQILGQDTLDYTAVKDESTLRITQAVGVKAEQAEREIERKRDAAVFYGREYDLVTIKGTLSVTNFQQKGIDLEIAKALSGEVKSFEPEAKVEKLAVGLEKVNPKGLVTWTLKLKAREQKQLTYVYDAYICR